MQWTQPFNRFVLKKKMLMGHWFSSIRCPTRSGALYATITHDPRSEYNWQKKECSKSQQSWGIWGCSETPAGPLRKFSGSKEHLNWLKIDFNAAEIIFKIISLHKINVNGSTHIQR